MRAPEPQKVKMRLELRRKSTVQLGVSCLTECCPQALGLDRSVGSDNADNLLWSKREAKGRKRERKEHGAQYRHTPNQNTTATNDLGHVSAEVQDGLLEADSV